MQIDTTHAGNGALSAHSARELCRSARYTALVLALVAGLLGMHVLGGHGTHSMAAPAQTITAASHATAHSTHAEASIAECSAGQPGTPADASVHCIPAPGTVPLTPPAILDLDRSDALPRPAEAALGPVRARAPAPDLTQLSISRT